MLSSIGLGLLSLAVLMSFDAGHQDRPAPHARQIEPRNASVTLGCSVGPSTRVENCEVVHESHPGQGFAEAALAAASDARLSTETRRTGSAGERVRFTIRFDVEDAGPVVSHQPPVSIFDLL